MIYLFGNQFTETGTSCLVGKYDMMRDGSQESITLLDSEELLSERQERKGEGERERGREGRGGCKFLPFTLNSLTPQRFRHFGTLVSN